MIVNSRAIHLGSILTATLLLAGCASTSSGPLLGFQDSTEITKTRLIDQAERLSTENSQGKETEGVRGFSSVEHDGITPMGNKAVDAYLHSIAGRLIAAYPGQKPNYSIKCIFSDSLDAHASYSNNVFISTGWLMSVSSEDELAALIAHELSHLILSHPFTLQNRRDDQDDLGNLIVITSTMTSVVESKGSSFLPANSKAPSILMAGIALLEAKKTLWDPEINRRQEEDADFLAIDLLDKAGYNRDGMILILQMLDRYRDSIRAKELKQEQEMTRRQDDIDKMIMANIEAGNIDQALSSGINNGIKILGETIQREAASRIKHLRSTHMDPVVREGRASEYIDNHYPTLPPRLKSSELSHALQKTGFHESREAFTDMKLAEAHALHGNILTASKVIKSPLAKEGRQSSYAWEVNATIDQRKNDTTSEVTSLKKSIDLGGSPKTFNRLAEIYLSQGKADQALGVLDMGEKKYGDDSVFIPGRVRVLAAKGDNINYEAALDACAKQKSKSIKAECEAFDAQKSGGKAGIRALKRRIGL